MNIILKASWTGFSKFQKHPLTFNNYSLTLWIIIIPSSLKLADIVQILDLKNGFDPFSLLLYF